MAHEVLVTSKEFEGLKNPYTGLRLRTMMVVPKSGDPMFHCSPEQYSTADPQPTTKDLYRLWNRIDGVEGMKTNNPLVCAYTGEPLTAVKYDGKYYYDGGFDPHRLYTREEYLYYATMRGGKPSRSYPVKPERVTKVTEKPEISEGQRKNCEDKNIEITDDAVKMALDQMAKTPNTFQKSNTVRVTGYRKAGKH